MKLTSVCNRSIELWDLYTSKRLNILRGHVKLVTSLAISPDGTILASGSEHHTIKLWNLQTGELLHTLTGHSRAVTVELPVLEPEVPLPASFAISPDGMSVVSGSEDSTIKVWGLG